MQIITNISLLILILFALNAKSQDLIFYNNNKDTIKCKIINDKVQFLEYKLNNDTSLYRISQDKYDFYIQQNEFTKNDTIKNKEFTLPNLYKNDTTINNFAKKQLTPQYPQFGFGFGIGLDYGGILGIKITSIPFKFLSVFFGLGYNLNDAGVNIGALYRIAPKQIICPFFGIMYGYNAVIVIIGAENYNKTYYGSSFTFGLEFRSAKLKNFFSIGLNIPNRSDSFEKDIQSLKQNPNIKITQEPPDALLTIGYHIII